MSQTNMKLSFSLPSKAKPSSAKPNQTFILNQDDQSNNKDHRNEPNSQPQFVTEFDPSKTLTQQPNTIFIPPKENTWNFLPKKMRNLVPSDVDSDAASALQFEPENPSAATDPLPNVSYGLNLRPSSGGPSSNDSSHRAQDLILQNFHDEMNNLPDDRGFDEFKDTPIEGFGAALLAGYGWTQGKGIGRNAKEDVKVPQYVRRGNKEGIGFVPVPEVHGVGHKLKNLDAPLVAPRGPDGRTRHVVTIDEKLVPREAKGVLVGKVARVVDGRHWGLKGKVVEISGGRVVLKLLNSGEQVRVGFGEVAEIGSVEEEKCLRRLQQSKNRDERRDSSYRDPREKEEFKEEEKEEEKRNQEKRSRRRRRDEEDERSERPSKSSSRNGEPREEENPRDVSWLTSHIRVRIISKSFRGGRFYLKKGEVMDVVGPMTCDISMDESKEIIQGVDQEFLETAIPKNGGPVLVLYGRHKGVYGNLVQRDKEKEIGVVRDVDTHELFKVRLEQIAEYIGDPSFLGY